MRIPPTLLSPAALRAIIEEFVTRDGTDLTSVETRIATVMRQLDAGVVDLHYDDTPETCTIVTMEQNPPLGDEHG
jgi:uncharacterized protein YheU (UPF0270 family)